MCHCISAPLNWNWKEVPLKTILLASMESFSLCQRPFCPVKKKKNKGKR